MAHHFQSSGAVASRRMVVATVLSTLRFSSAMLPSGAIRRPSAAAPRVSPAIPKRGGLSQTAPASGRPMFRPGTAATGVRSASTLPDVCGLPVATSSWEAIKSLDKAYFEYANLSGDPFQRIQEAIGADPSCVMAHCLLGLLAAIGQGHPEVVAACLASAEKEFAASIARPADSDGASAADLASEGIDGRGDRERVLLTTLRAWSAGHWRKGALILESWLMRSPTDLPILKLTQDAHLTLGDSVNLRDCVGRVLPSWSEGTYGYGNALGMHAFGLVENGSYSFAEEQADMAMGKQPKDMWAVHAMSHVYEMQGRASEGCSFLTDCRDKWEDEPGPLIHHMAWHLGLFSLERGQEKRAQRVFDTLIAPPREGGQQDGALKKPLPAPFPLTDATSLLWRMDLLGVETGAARWRGVAEAWYEYRHARHLSTFQDVHSVMAFAAMAHGVEDDAEAQMWQNRAKELLVSMKAYVENGGDRLKALALMSTLPEDGISAKLDADSPSSASSSGPVKTADPGAGSHGSPSVKIPIGLVELHSFASPRRRSLSSAKTSDGGDGTVAPPDNLWTAQHVGLSLCEAMLAYRAGMFEEAVSTLLPLRHHVGAIGGSKAQQDFLHLTLIDAALRLQDQATAKSLVCERRSQRPTSGRAWEAYATVMEREGNLREAFDARKVAFEFGIGQGGVGAN